MGIKLTIGLLRDAWISYPADRAALASFPPGPPVFLGGTHRSGTTWVAQMLAGPGLWYIHEPFNPNKGLWPESFTYVPPSAQDDRVDAMVASILRGGKRRAAHHPHAVHPLMPLRLFRPPVRRILVKDPLACLLTGYFATHFPFLARVLFRHPAGFVASIQRLGWPTGTFLRQFLGREALMRDHLEPVRPVLERYADADGVEAAAALHGALNLVQWNQVSAHPAIKYYLFESLCRDPIASFAGMFIDLGLTYTEETRRRHEQLCFGGSSRPVDYRTHAVARNSRAMADSWKHQLHPDEVARIRAVWERFDIPLYRDAADWSIDPDNRSA